MRLDNYQLKKAIVTLSLFTLQLILVFTADNRIDFNYASPFLLLIVSLIIPYYYILVLGKKEVDASSIAVGKPWSKYVYFGLGMLAILVNYKGVGRLFAQYPDPGEISDVMPQIETQYSRFVHGILPYSPVTSVPWHPYPVYMPLHWLPVGVAHMLGIDSRWSGYIILVIAGGIYGRYILQYRAMVWRKMIVLLVLWAVLWAYMMWGGMDLPAVLETLIAAYYLVLAVGLMTRNLTITTIGIILCLLSRYTFVFWLPLFFILLWQHKSIKQNLMIWFAIAVAVLCIYIIPFWSKDPTIFTKGLAYHNYCAYNSWRCFGTNQTYDFYKSGLLFAPRVYDITTGTIEHRVFLARCLQGGLMLFLFAAGLWLYAKIKSRINFYDFSLMMLYVFILVFMLFAPFVFRYYYMPVLVLSAVICAKIVLVNKKEIIENNGSNLP